MQAYTEIERNTLEWTSAYLRELGYKGFITAYNNGVRVQARAAGRDLGLIGLHAYYDQPRNYIREGNSQAGTSSIPDLVPYVRHFATSRYAGRPFIVDEYDHPFWSSWRREAGMLVPAYAAFQDWDAICRYKNPVHLQYGQFDFRRHQAIFPFSVGMDPVARAGETLAALLFRRGDVRTAEHRVALDLTPFFVYRRTGRDRMIPGVASRIALLNGVGLRWRERGYHFDKDSWQPHVSYTVMSPWHQRHRPELLDRSQAKRAHGVYRTDTGEITLDTGSRMATVVTRQTEAVSFDSKLPVALPHLEVRESSGPAMVSVSALDDKALPDSQRLLLIYATDALNSDMLFSDAARSSVLELGALPVLMKTGQVQLSLRHARPGDLTLYAIGLDSERREKIALEPVPGGVAFTLDTATLEYGPTTYFELVVEAN